MSALPVLYSFRRCPYAMRARLALAVSGQACELREVVLRDKPHGLLQASPKSTVPVLVLPGGQVLEQSLEIMRWALQRHDPLHWLNPGVGTLEAMLAQIADCDGPFKQALDRCKYPQRYPGADVAAARAQACAWLAALDAQLAGTGHLFGRHTALADAAIFPFVRQFAGIDAALVVCASLAAPAALAGALDRIAPVLSDHGEIRSLEGRHAGRALCARRRGLTGSAAAPRAAVAPHRAVRSPRTSSPARAAPSTTKQTNDQLAMEPPRKVQSIAAQSPEPLKIIGMARLMG